MVLQGEGELRPQGLRKEERRGILREIADRLRDIGGVHTRRVLVRDEHLAGGWPVQTGDEPQQRRLARSVAPHERDQLARSHLEIDVAQHGVAVPAGAYPLQCDDRGAARGSRIGSRRSGHAAERRVAALGGSPFLDRERQRVPVESTPEREQRRQTADVGLAHCVSRAVRRGRPCLPERVP